MELKDILPFYIGQKCFVPELNKIGKLYGFTDHGDEIIMLDIVYNDDHKDYDVLNENYDITRIKLILRPLESMTDEDYKIIGTSGFGGTKIHHWTFAPEAFIYMLSKGFDIFGAKEKGWAIYEL